MEEEGARQPPGADLISALPEDLLLQVLRRLGCARAAARTSLLSRCWRRVWIRLPDLIFRDVPIRSIQAALSSLQGAVDPEVSLVDIASTWFEAAAGGSLPVPWHERVGKAAACVRSLLHAAAGLSPLEFHFALPPLERTDADLPAGFCRRTTSIQLSALNLRLTLPPSTGAFPRLEKLCLFGCSVDLTALVLRCPCLRVLRVNQASLDAAGIIIQSDSLQNLSVRTSRRCRWTERVNVEAPMLKQLAVSIGTSQELSVSVMAPVLEKVSWECSYAARIAGFQHWALTKVRLYAAQSLGLQRIDTCLQLSNVYVLSLQVSCDWFAPVLNFVQQIKNHLVTDFSVLELTMVYGKGLRSAVHSFGPLVLHLLGMHRIRTATRRLQIHFLRPKVRGRCPENCSCNETNNWRGRNISLINLEEVEIADFEGEDNEFDFLKVIFRSTPMLKRMAVRTLAEFTTSNDRRTKIQDIFKAYPSVECSVVYPSTGPMHNSQCGVAT